MGSPTATHGSPAGMAASIDVRVPCSLGESDSAGPRGTSFGIERPTVDLLRARRQREQRSAEGANKVQTPPTPFSATTPGPLDAKTPI